MYCSAIGFGIFIILAGLCSISQGSDKCYFAKTCVHDGKEKCGKDSGGNVRRFIDSCDIKEYNCLKDTDYRKTSPKDCKSLPPIDEQEENDAKDKRKPSAAGSSMAADNSKDPTESNENVAKGSEAEIKAKSQETESE